VGRAPSPARDALVPPPQEPAGGPAAGQGARPTIEKPLGFHPYGWAAGPWKHSCLPRRDLSRRWDERRQECPITGNPSRSAILRAASPSSNNAGAPVCRASVIASRSPSPKDAWFTSAMTGPRIDRGRIQGQIETTPGASLATASGAQMSQNSPRNGSILPTSLGRRLPGHSKAFRAGIVPRQ
jgi:hypothetical protein